MAPGPAPTPGEWDINQLLEVKPISMLGGDKFAERNLFDEKVAGQAAYQYDGTKGGIA